MTNYPNQPHRKPLVFPSQVGADYTTLANLLAEKKWQQADWETRQLMLFIAGADKRRERLLTQEDMQKFPCTDLHSLNQLWIHYSQGRFGFSAIKQIYQELGCDYSRLAERVGWRIGDKWIKYDEVIFTSDAPVGHLPITWLVPMTFSTYWLARFASVGWRLLLERAVDCSL